MTQQKSHWKFETIICFWSKPSLISPLRFISVFQNYVLFSLWSWLDINRITGIILISSFQFELPAAYIIHFKRKQKVKLFYQLLTILKSVPNNIKDTENCFCEENCHERKKVCLLTALMLTSRQVKVSFIGFIWGSFYYSTRFLEVRTFYLKASLHSVTITAMRWLHLQMVFIRYQWECSHKKEFCHSRRGIS